MGPFGLGLLKTRALAVANVGLQNEASSRRERLYPLPYFSGSFVIPRAPMIPDAQSDGSGRQQARVGVAFQGVLRPTRQETSILLTKRVEAIQAAYRRERKCSFRPSCVTRLGSAEVLPIVWLSRTLRGRRRAERRTGWAWGIYWGSMYEHFPFPDCRVEQVTRAGPERVELAVRATRPEAACPTCLTPSDALHSHYRRHPADLPSLGQAVCLKLSVRRFYCRNPACPRRTFAEPRPGLLNRRARRTQRLASAQAQVGIALGGEAGARLLHRLAMPASADTVLRLVRGLPLPVAEAPRVVGVDEWALTKCQHYGTILVDLESRRVADLLPERSAPALAAWLQARGSVQVIARDRSGEYARGATLGAPAALQVADRWHLLDNLRQMLARWLAGLHGRLAATAAGGGGRGACGPAGGALCTHADRGGHAGAEPRPTPGPLRRGPPPGRRR